MTDCDYSAMLLLQQLYVKVLADDADVLYEGGWS